MNKTPAPHSLLADNASGSEAKPAEVTSDGGPAGNHSASRMAWNGTEGARNPNVRPLNYAWICSIPGVPAWWPKASRIERELDAIRREAL